MNPFFRSQSRPYNMLGCIISYYIILYCITLCYYIILYCWRLSESLETPLRAVLPRSAHLRRRFRKVGSSGTASAIPKGVLDNGGLWWLSRVVWERFMKYVKLGSCMDGFQRQLRVPLLLYDYRTPPPAPPLLLLLLLLPFTRHHGTLATLGGWWVVISRVIGPLI